MKLQDKLPEGVTVDGRFYKLDFDFRNVLQMMDELDRDDVMPQAKTYNALKCLCKHPKNVFKVMEAVKALLFQEKPKKDAQKVTDFVQDAGMIRAAFRQAYGIDLYRDKLHWIEFSELLNAIPQGSRYTEVIGIRARPIPAPTKWNAEERKWLINAKADVAIRLSEKEQAKKYAEDVAKVFNGIMGMIVKGSENDG
jgi:hypothetical protein